MKPRTIPAVRDRRSRETGKRQSDCKVRVDIDGRLLDLQSRVAQGKPLFEEGEGFSAGYGAFKAGTLADENACDVLDARKGTHVAR